jgi:hypothetical protein
MRQVYTINPIPWEPGIEPGVIEAQTPLGLFRISPKYGSSKKKLIYCAGVELHFKGSVARAKALAWKHYKPRMEAGLTPIKPVH